MQECLFLVLRHGDLRSYLEEFIRLDTKSSEEVLLVARVLISSAEPLPDHRLVHAGNLTDFVAEISRDRLRDGNFMMRHQTEFLSGSGRRQKQAAIQCKHHAQQ